MKSIISLSALLTATFVLTVVAEDTDRKVDFFPYNLRIAGGDYAEIGQFPHQIAIQTHRTSSEKGEYMTFCGGSLISDEFVLTAAHCLHGSIFAEIFLGVTNFTGSWYRMVIKKENMIVHEKYDPAKIRDDLALVRLPQKAPISAIVNTINLPRFSQSHLTFEKNVGWIQGWGNMGDTGKKASGASHLQYARRWILADEFCFHHFPSYESIIHMCIDGSHGISACHGDSGGPVFIEEEDSTRTLVGIASFARREGCEKNFPVVYSRVASYLNWISEKTGITIKE